MLKHKATVLEVCRLLSEHYASSNAVSKTVCFTNLHISVEILIEL